jgi:hypothetical protein
MLLIASIPLHHLFQFQTANDEDRVDGGRPKRSKKNPVIAPLRDAINLRHHPKKVTLNCLTVDVDSKQQDPRQVILKDANGKAKDIVSKAAKGSVKSFPLKDYLYLSNVQLIQWHKRCSRALERMLKRKRRRWKVCRTKP